MTISALTKTIKNHVELSQVECLLNQFSSDLQWHINCVENDVEYRLTSFISNNDLPVLKLKSDSSKQSLLYILKYCQLYLLNDAVKLLWIKAIHSLRNDYNELPEIMRALTLPDNKSAIAELVRTSKLNDEILSFCAEKNMKWQAVAQLLRFSEPLLLFLVKQAQSLHLTANYFVSFAEKLSRYCQEMSDDLAFMNADIQSILSKEQLPVQRRAELDNFLKKETFKALSKGQLIITEKINKISKNDSVNISWDDSLENRYLDINARVTSKQDIETLQDWLSENEDKLTDVLGEL